MKNKISSTILFIMHMPPPVHGASMVGKYIHDSKLVNETFNCHYINLTTADTLADIGKIGLRKVKSFVKLLNSIEKEIKRLCPDTVYITPNSAGGAFYKDFVVVEIVKRAMRKCGRKDGNIVLHFHNKGVSTRQERWLDDKLYTRFFKGVDVMLLAESLYGDISKYVERNNVVICGNGIPDYSTEDIVPIKESYEKELPHLLFLSNMMTTKGVWELLDALYILKRKGRNFVCDFVGGWKDIHEEEFCARVSEYGLSDCVYAHGAKYGMDKEEFFKRADIFVLPSYTEAFPLTVLEAMQYGLAVVASNVGGISGQVSDGLTGYLIGGTESILTLDYKPNPQELSDAIEKLLNDMDRCRTMGQEGLKRYKQEFTLQRFEERFCECIQKPGFARKI